MLGWLEFAPARGALLGLLARWWLRGIDRADGVPAVQAGGAGAEAARGVHADGWGDRLGAAADPDAGAPADLINVALEELVRARLELPAYGTLDELAASIRAQVNTAVFAGIATWMTPAEAAVADGLLEVDPVRRRSDFDRLGFFFTATLARRASQP